MKHEKSCGAICYTREEGAPRVLVICHRYGGHWAFPKGHVEAGESEEETAMREVREETGAQVRVRPGYREVTTYSPAKGVTKDVVFFVAEIDRRHAAGPAGGGAGSLPAAAGGSTAPADLCRRQGIAGKGKKYDSGRKKRLTTVFDYDNIYDALQKRSGMRC